MKNNRSGQSAIFSSSDRAKLRSKFKKVDHRLMFDVAIWTGERWGAIRQLRVSDVFDERTGKPLEMITFRAQTRKASPNGERKTRQVPVHSNLRDALASYKFDKTRTFLFEGESGEPMSFSAIDQAFRRAIARAGLEAKGYSTHSTRRTFITELSRKGVDVRTLQGLTGHSDVRVLMRYVEQSPERLRNAIEML